MSVRPRREGKWKWWEISFTYRDRDGTPKRVKEAAKGARNRSQALAYETKRKAEVERKGAAPTGKVPLFAATREGVDWP